MLATDSGRLKLAATDLETTVCHWTGAQVVIEGAVTAPCQSLMMTPNMHGLLLILQTSPIAIRPVGHATRFVEHVIMPMQTQEADGPDR